MPLDDAGSDLNEKWGAPKQVILGVSGGIAAYKAADLCSKLVQAGAEVRVVFSASADRFIAPLTFEALCGHAVYRDVFANSAEHGMEHISWARWAEALVVAPASADTIARLALGRADDALSALHLAFAGKVYVAPSMNSVMLAHPATAANLETLRSRGVQVIAPGSGSLACGEVGAGRMAEPLEIMVALGFPVETAAVGTVTKASGGASRPGDNTLEGRTVLITSGPTREFLDPVRFISSPSSGRMGLALANDALRRGAKVHFVSGPVDEGLLPCDTVDARLELHRVQSAREMFDAVDRLKAETDVFVFAAAVGDFRPAQNINSKIKRSGNSITLPLVENPDIAQAVGFAREPGQVLIGFAAESDAHHQNARSKIATKRLDAIVLNDIANPEIGFVSPENEVVIITADGQERLISRRAKAEVAFEVLEVARELLDKNLEQGE